MKFLLLLAFLLITFNASGKDYLEYYQIVARAEASAVHGAYVEALDRYDSAFTNAAYNNPIDLYSAAQIAGFVRQPTRAAAYLLNGISFGLPLQTAQSNPHLKEAIATRGDQFQLEADSCGEIYRGRINAEARGRVIALIGFDQAVIRRAGSIYRKDGRTLKEEYTPVWDSLLRELTAITQKWGYPAQKITGTQNGDDNIFRVGPGNSFAWYILVHHGNAWSVLKDLLPGELRKGNITPQMYGAIADNCNGHSDYTRMEYFSLRPCEAVVDRKRCNKAIAGRLDRIDEARRQIGLCSYDVAALKMRSTSDYYSWLKGGAKEAKPAFDFQVSFNNW